MEFQLDHTISTPMCEAAKRGETDTVLRLLRKGHSVNRYDNRGWTPLHVAISHGHLAFAGVLLENGSNVNAQTFEGVTPMFIACMHQNDTKLIDLLGKYNANCDLADVYDVTPLHIACKYNKIELVRELLKMGAKVNCQDMNSFTPLMEAIDQSSLMAGNRIPERRIETIRLLLDNGASLKITELNGRTPLVVAVCNRWEECVKLLLEYGSNVNASTKDGATALSLAAQMGNLSIVELLLKWKARTDIVCKIGTVPLHHALHGGRLRVAAKLLENMNWNKLINQKKSRLRSFLAIAIDSGSFDCFKFVVDHKLFCAAIDESEEFVEKRELNTETFPHYKLQPPLSLLLSLHMDRSDSIPIMMELLQLGNSVNAEDNAVIPPLTALTCAFSYSKIELCNQNKMKCFYLLLQSGANIDYCSVQCTECTNYISIPDAVLAVLLPQDCAKYQILLLPILANCFACDWDELLLWLMKYRTCSAPVIYALMNLCITNKNILLQLWDSMKQCPCCFCFDEFKNVFKSLSTKSDTLESLCRSRVRRLLWSRTKDSAQCKQLLEKLVPRPLLEIIVPENKWKNSEVTPEA